MRPAKIVAIVIGALLIVIGLALVLPGSLLLWMDGRTDSAGFLSTGDRAVSSTGHALTTPRVRLDIGAGDWMPGDLAVQIRATSDSPAPIFIGIGPTVLVNSYLDGVAHDEVTDLDWFRRRPEYLYFSGSKVPPPPGEQGFWVAMQEGSGTQTLRWDVRDGEWTAVVMNADGSAPLAARVSLGIRVGFLLPLGIGVTVFGVILLAVGILLVVLGARRPREPVPVVTAPTEPGVYPTYVPPVPSQMSPAPAGQQAAPATWAPPASAPSSVPPTPPPGEPPPGEPPSAA